MEPVTPLDVRPRDPLRTYQFRVKFAGEGTRYIAGVRAVSGLSWTIASYETWSGGNNYHPYRTPNRVTWDPITLEQGIALDDTLGAWAEAARAMAEMPNAAAASSDARRNLQIDILDFVKVGAQTQTYGPATVVQSYIVYNAWVSKLVALPRLDAMTSEVALSSVEITHEGWRRSQPTT